MGGAEVTVVVTAQRGRGRCFESLAAQTLDPGRFEIVVVHAGDDAAAASLADAVELAQQAEPAFGVRLVRVGAVTAGSARNAGVAAAHGRYVTFLDEDDTVSATYLAALLGRSAPELVALALRVDLAEGASPRFDTLPSRDVLPHAGRRVPAEQVVRALSAVGAAMLPTALVREIGFDADLPSGEEIVFWADLLATRPMTFAVCDIEEHAVLYRAVPAGWHSPQPDSFAAEVVATLDAIDRVGAGAGHWPPLRGLVTPLTDLQTGHLNAYLRRHPEQHGAVLAELRRRQLSAVSWERLNDLLGRELAILYAAPPYSDTAGTVAARRVAAAGAVVDVVSCRFAGQKPLDPSLDEVWRPYVDRRFETPTRVVSAWWPAMVDYCRQGLAVIERWAAEKGPYRRVYSRVMWPSAHLLAAAVKVRHPEIEWVAEFSDPLLFNIDGDRRVGSGQPDRELLDEFTRALAERGLPAPEEDEPYTWLEWLAFGLADTVIFTNENQRRYMLEHFPAPALTARVERVGRIVPHPTPEAHLYTAVHSDYPLPADRVNVGYFGAFYTRRGLTEVVGALQRLDGPERERICLHVFTADPDALRTELLEAGLADVVRANPYVGYLEYLNLTTRFDALLVNDARTADAHEVNPYLPSKWSEYAGSGRPVWGIVEAGSMLDGKPLTYRSELGDVDGALAVLRLLAAAREPVSAG